MGNKASLGDRMKEYENVERRYLTRRMPTIIRLDGKAFHTFTAGFQKPFDMIFMQSMWETTQYLCKNIEGCKIGYTQSDEIELLMIDYESLTTNSWFDKNILKIVSVSASMATLAFNKSFREQVRALFDEKTMNVDTETKRDCYLKYIKRIDTALFDSRAFNIPKEEVCNAFIWRQQDATRNAIEAVGQAYFSSKQLHGKSNDQIQEMLFQEKGINFNDYPVYQKRGACVIKEYYVNNGSAVEGNNGSLVGGTVRSRWIVDKNIPIFTKDRNYIEAYV